MTREQFWALVEQTRSDAQHSLPPRRGLLRRRRSPRPGEHHVAALRRALDKLADDELVSFQSHLDALRAEAADWSLWGAGDVACGGMGDDTFLDFRTWLVSQGRATYTRVLDDADALAEVAPVDLDERIGDAEIWGYVALDVWDARSDAEMPRPAIRPTEPAGEPVDPEDEGALRRRYPRLAARFL